MKFRIEKDYLGEMKVPAHVLYGIHTQRARENFQISGQPLPLDIFHAITEIKIAAARANMELNLLEREKAEAIVEAGKDILNKRIDDFVIDAFQAGAGTPTHMNVNEVIANRAIELLGGERGDYRVVHPNDQVNMGQSSNNVFPSAIKIAAYKQLDALLSTLNDLESTLRKNSKTFNSILKSGRTHLQDTVPLTLGQEFHAYATAISKNISRITKTRGIFKELNVGKNAVGTGVNTFPNFTKLILTYLEKINHIPWKEAKDPIYATQFLTDFLEVSGTLRLLAVDVNKVADDLRFLSSGPNTGLREIHLPAVEPGSSIMPGKINPSIPEMINMSCFQVMGNDHTIQLCTQAGQLDMNVMTPLIAKNLLESITILSNSVAVFSKRCVQGITVNEEICRFYFEHSTGLATFLNPYLGYDTASQIAQESLRTGESIYTIVLKKDLIEKHELDRLFDSKNVTHPNLQKGKTTRRK